MDDYSEDLPDNVTPAQLDDLEPDLFDTLPEDDQAFAQDPMLGWDEENQTW